MSDRHSSLVHSTCRDIGARAPHQLACSDCALLQVCLPVGLTPTDVSELDRLIERPRSLRRGEHLFRPGEPMSSVYAVRSGSIKAYAPARNGGVQVVRFYLPGDLLGLDAIDDEIHPYGAQALETSSLCAIPIDELETLSQTVAGLRRHILRLMSRLLQHEQAMLVMLRQTRAEQRVAAFLRGLSVGFQRRGFSAVEFRLSMSRRDIASYLGLTKETVCRVYSRFHEAGMIEIDRRRVRILDPAGLGAAANALA